MHPLNCFDIGTKPEIGFPIAAGFSRRALPKFYKLVKSYNFELENSNLVES